MRIDPGNKIFIAIFSVIVVGVIGFLIASIFIDFGGDVEVKKIEFQRSNFSIVVTQLKKDKKYVVQLFNGKDTPSYQNDNSASDVIDFLPHRRTMAAKCKSWH